MLQTEDLHCSRLLSQLRADPWQSPACMSKPFEASKGFAADITPKGGRACLVALVLWACSVYALVVSFRDGKAGNTGYLVVDVSHQQGFAEARQLITSALVAAHHSDRCLLLQGFPNADGSVEADFPFSMAVLSDCAAKVQVCMGKPSRGQVLPKDAGLEMSFATTNSSALLNAKATYVSWSSVILPQDPQGSEDIFWKVIGCIDSSRTLTVINAAAIARSYLNDTYNMILSASDILKTKWPRQECPGSRCESMLAAENLAEHLQHKGMHPSTQMLLADDIDTKSEEGLARHLKSIHYDAIEWHKLMLDQKVTPGIQREVLYMIGQQCQKLLTNTDRDGNAMLYLHRHHSQSWASSSSFRQIPLARKVPYFTLPWVFTYNSWSPKYDYMLKACVRSALVNAPLLKPFCIFTGKPQHAKLYGWLLRSGVTIIHHQPAWQEAFAAKLQGNNNLKFSHLFRTADMQIGTWQRIDIPILPDLSEYNYCLFTDSDVYFRGAVSLNAFGSPLPPVIGMGYERENHFPPLNAGVMLMNLPSLASSYGAFLQHVLENENGLIWPGYGPGDQGAINYFYEASIRPHRLNSIFNSKPYHAWKSEAKILHFHGPKPFDYWQYMTSGNCPFQDYCQTGLEHGFCKYALEWASFVQDEPLGRHVSASCQLLEAAHS